MLGVSPHLNRDDLAAAQKIADDVGRLPVALDILAQHRARLQLGFAEYRRRFLAPLTANHPSEDALLRTLDRACENFVAATRHKGRIYDTIGRAYLSLNPAAQTLLAAASCFAPDGLGQNLLRAVLGPDVDDETWYEALADLADASLISEDPLPPEQREAQAEPDAPRLRLHELVRLFARMQFTEEEHRTHVVRLAAALTDRLQQANDKLDWRGIRPETAHLAHSMSECSSLGLSGNLYPLLIARGQFLIHHRDFAGADAMLREGLALVERLHKPIHRSRAQALRLLGENAQMQGDGRSALRDAWTALRIARRAYGRDDPERRAYYSTVGFILKEQGQFDRARSFYLGMIAFSVRVLGPMHPDVALGLNNLGMLCFQQGRLEEAEKHLREALAIEQAQASLSGSTSGTAIYWNSLGRILGQQEHWAESLDCHQAALEINERIHGASHPSYVTSLYYSAVAAHALKRWHEAEVQYQDVLHLCQRLFGADNFRCAEVEKKVVSTHSGPRVNTGIIARRVLQYIMLGSLEHDPRRRTCVPLYPFAPFWLALSCHSYSGCLALPKPIPAAVRSSLTAKTAHPTCRRPIPARLIKLTSRVKPPEPLLLHSMNMYGRPIFSSDSASSGLRLIRKASSTKTRPKPVKKQWI